MKIKTKKQLNLPQLIEWAMNNDVKDEMFLIDQNKKSGIRFTKFCDFKLYKADFINSTDTFTVEVEELINETTRFEMLAEINGTNTIYGHCNSRIVDIVNYQDTEIHAYIDGEFKCIWRDGKLVE